MGEPKDIQFKNEEDEDKGKDHATPQPPEWLRRRDKIDISRLTPEEFDAFLEGIESDLDKDLEGLEWVENEKKPPLVRLANSAQLLLELDYKIRTNADLEKAFAVAQERILGHEEEFVEDFDFTIREWLENLIQYKDDVESFRLIYEQDKSIAISGLFDKYSVPLHFDPSTALTVTERYGILFGLANEDFDKYGQVKASGLHQPQTPISFARANPIPDRRVLIHENQHAIRDGLFGKGYSLGSRLSKFNEMIHDQDANDYVVSGEAEIFAKAIERKVKSEINAALSHSKRLDPMSDPLHSLIILATEESESKPKPPRETIGTFSSAIKQLNIAKGLIEQVDFDPNNQTHQLCKAYLERTTNKLEESILMIVEMLNSDDITPENADKFQVCFMLLPSKNIKLIGKLQEMVPNRTDEEKAALVAVEKNTGIINIINPEILRSKPDNPDDES